MSVLIAHRQSGPGSPSDSPPLPPASFPMDTAPRVLPDVAAALAWRDWPAGLVEARRRRVPILALAEPPWTNSAQRLAFVFQQDDDLRTLIERRVVPVFLDPVERPDLAARWRWASIALTGTAGPPLLVLLTHEGLPFLAACSMWPEGRPPYPSLASVIRATTEAYEHDASAFAEDATGLPGRVADGAPHSIQAAEPLWQALQSEIDSERGGFRENPKHPHPQALRLLLDLAEEGDVSDARQFVVTTLQRMSRGGINDQIGQGFHRCARDDRWIVPHFEKPAPLNAQLAALFARAARLTADEELGQTADQLVAFCLASVRTEVDAVGSDGDFYTWTPQELLESVDPGSVQAVSFAYHVTPHRSRHVLYRALEPEAMDRYSHESPEELRRRIAEGRRQLYLARLRRPRPPQVRLSIPSWTAETLRWLFVAAEEGRDVPTGALEDRLARLIDGHFREGSGYARTAAGGETPPAWLDDQAAVLAALTAAHRATNADRWLEEARRLADVVLERYRGESGWLDRPVDRDGAQPSWSVTDDVVPAAIGVLTDALVDLAALTGDDRYANVAGNALGGHLPSAAPCLPWSGGIVRAAYRAQRATPVEGGRHRPPADPTFRHPQGETLSRPSVVASRRTREREEPT